jgi:iron(III) transport system substrate-binding protein
MSVSLSPTRADRPLGGSMAGFLAAALLSLASCAEPADVVIYCALDQVDSEPILKEFEKRTGLKVRAEFDIEAHKTVGLVRRIREERGHPRCDVFWNNEIAHTVSLAKDGFLAEYDSPSAAGIPETFRDPQRRWTGFAARARVFIVNTDLADPADVQSMWDLVDDKWSGKCGMARPLTGTTLTHMTALFVKLGEERTLEYLTKVKSGGVNLTSGNATLMRLVSEGEFAWGWTDTDDFNRARIKGAPVAMVFPDSADDGLGTLFIPNTISVLKDAPHPDAARQLLDYLLSEEVEAKLASFDGAQIPLHESLRNAEHQLPLEQMKPMDVDYSEIGAQIDARFESLREMFLD